MLGSALRFGTTEHFQPAPEQLKGIPEKGIPGLKWQGNNADKLASMAKVFTDTLFHENPELAKYGYDFKRGTFTDPSGAAIPRTGLIQERLVGKGVSAQGRGS